MVLLGVDADFAVVGADAFAHAAEAYAGAVGADGGEFFGGEAVAGVAGFDQEAGGIVGDADVRGFAAGMAVNIAETFLHHAEDGQLQFVGQAVEFVDGQIDLDGGALLQALDIPSQGGAQAEFIEQRRMEQVGSGANFLIQFASEGDGFLDQGANSGADFVRFGVGFGPGFGAVLLAGFCGDLIEIHGNGRDDLTGAIVQIAGEAAALFILSGHQADGKFAELLGLYQDIVGANFEFAGAGVDLSLERIGEVEKAFLALAQRGFGVLAAGDFASGAGDQFHFSLAVEHRAKNIFVVAGDSGGAGVLGLVDDFFAGFVDELNLALQPGGEIVGIFEVEKVFADGFGERQAPKFQQRMVDENEAAVAVENVSEVGDGGESDIEDAGLPIEAETKVVRVFSGFLEFQERGFGAR